MGGDLRLVDPGMGGKSAGFHLGFALGVDNADLGGGDLVAPDDLLHIFHPDGTAEELPVLQRHQHNHHRLVVFPGKDALGQHVGLPALAGFPVIGTLPDGKVVARRGMHHSGFIHQPQRGIDAQHLAVGLERGQVFFPGGIRAIGLAQQGHLVQPPAQKVINLPRLCAGYRFQQGIDLGAQHQCRDPEGEHQQHHHGA